jgi:hypothetical protein
MAQKSLRVPKTKGSLAGIRQRIPINPGEIEERHVEKFRARIAMFQAGEITEEQMRRLNRQIERRNR